MESSLFDPRFDPRGGSQSVFLFSTLKVIFLAVGFLYLYLSDAIYILCTTGVQKAISHLLENKAKLHTKHHVGRTYHLNAKYLFKRKVSSSLRTILDHLWGFLSYRNMVMTGLMNLGQAIVQPEGGVEVSVFWQLFKEHLLNLCQNQRSKRVKVIKEGLTKMSTLVDRMW